VIFRRRSLPPHLETALDAFHAVLEELEPAKAGLTDVLPGTRMPGRPLHHAVGEFEERLARAERLMPAWRRDELGAEWQRCDEGLRESLRLASVVRERPPELEGFESLLGLVEQLLDPLDPFALAEERFRRLRA
jgi:hypothetical protein